MGRGAFQQRKCFSWRQIWLAVGHIIGFQVVLATQGSWAQQTVVTSLLPDILSNDGNAMLQADLDGQLCQRSTPRSLTLVFVAASPSKQDVLLPGKVSDDCSSATFPTSNAPDFREVSAGAYTVRILPGRNQPPLLFQPLNNSSNPGINMVVTVVEAPVVRILGQSATATTSRVSIILTAGLDTPPAVPATLSLRLSDPSAAEVTPSTITWRPGEQTNKRFTLTLLRRVDPGNGRTQLWVEPLPVSNVVLAPANASAAATPQALRLTIVQPYPLFYAVPNHVVYRSGSDGAGGGNGRDRISTAALANMQAGGAGIISNLPTSAPRSSSSSVGAGSPAAVLASLSSDGSSTITGGSSADRTHLDIGDKRADPASMVYVVVKRASASPHPSTINYSAVVLQVLGCPSPSLCRSAVRGIGILNFKADQDSANVSIAVNWTALPQSAMLRVGLTLRPQDNAAIVDASENTTTLFVYGTDYGTCPAGTLEPWRDPIVVTPGNSSNASGVTKDQEKGTADTPASNRSANATESAAERSRQAGTLVSICSEGTLMEGLLESYSGTPMMSPVVAACEEGTTRIITPSTSLGQGPATAPALPKQSSSPSSYNTTSEQQQSKELSVELQVPFQYDLAAVYLPLLSEAETAVVMDTTCATKPTLDVISSAPPSTAAPSGDGASSSSVAAWARWSLPATPQPCWALVAVYLAMSQQQTPSSRTGSPISSPRPQTGGASTLPTGAANGTAGNTTTESSASGVPVISMAQVRAYRIFLQPLSDPAVFRDMSLQLRNASSGRSLLLCGLPAQFLHTIAQLQYGDDFTAASPDPSQLSWASGTLARAIRGNPDAVSVLRQLVGGTSVPSGLRRGLLGVVRRSVGSLMLRGWSAPHPMQDASTRTPRRHLLQLNATNRSTPSPSALPTSPSKSPTPLNSSPVCHGFDLPNGAGGTVHLLYNLQYVEWCDPADSQVVDLSIPLAAYDMVLEASSGGAPLKLHQDDDDATLTVVVRPAMRTALAEQEAAAAAAAAEAAQGSHASVTLGTSSDDADLVAGAAQAKSAPATGSGPASTPASATDATGVPSPAGTGGSVAPIMAPEGVIVSKQGQNSISAPSTGGGRRSLQLSTPAAASSAEGDCQPTDALLRSNQRLTFTVVAPDGVSTRDMAIDLYLDYRAAVTAALASPERCASPSGAGFNQNGTATQAPGNASTATPQQGATQQSTSPPLAQLPSGSVAPAPAGQQAATKSASSQSGALSGTAAMAAAGLLVLPRPHSPLDACTACGPGTYSTSADASSCLACGPGTFSSDAVNTGCTACPAGSFTRTWGNGACRLCPAGTFTARPGSTSCSVCPDGTTTLTDGAASCTSAPPPPSGSGGNGGGYALVVSFQMLLNMSGPGASGLSSLGANTTGIDASPDSILKLLIAADTADALRISPTQVRVSSLQELSPSAFLVNVSATLPLTAQPGGNGGAGGAVPSSKEFDADTLINRLVGDPDGSFPRTKEATGGSVSVSYVDRQVVQLGGHDGGVSPHAVLWPTLAGTAILAVVVGLACGRCWRRRRRGGSSAPHGALPPLSDALGGLVGSWSQGGGLPYFVYGEMPVLELQDMRQAAAAAARHRGRWLKPGSAGSGHGGGAGGMSGLGPGAQDAIASAGAGGGMDAVMYGAYLREGLSGPRI